MPARGPTRPAVALLFLLALATFARGQAQRDAEPRPSHPTASGTLVGYDAATRVLTVRNATGSLEFHVATDARFWLGSRRVPVSQLERHAGAEVTVAWSDAGGERTTHTVRVTDPPPARAK